MIELIVLLISIFISLIVIYWYNYSTEDMLVIENFKGMELDASVSDNIGNHYLSACPAGYKSFYDSNGDMICCNGDVLANKCLGDKQCILNGKGTSDMPNCVNAILEEYAEKAKSQCPSSMMSYFENKKTNIKGCTAGPLNQTLDSPKSMNQPTCKIYSNMEENIYSKDSCYNQKLLDNTPCFGNNCKKQIIQPIKNGAVLIGIEFTDSMGIHRTAYTRQSMENYLNKTNPNWRNQGIDLSKNISVAEVAKAYYVDRTIDKSEIQF